jgi:hypothetical protein
MTRQEKVVAALEAGVITRADVRRIMGVEGIASFMIPLGTHTRPLWQAMCSSRVVLYARTEAALHDGAAERGVTIEKVIRNPSPQVKRQTPKVKKLRDTKQPESKMTLADWAAYWAARPPRPDRLISRGAK